jgi:hypothetical protein
MVNNCGFARHSDFKQTFEDLPGRGRPIVAAIGLTQTDTMLIKRSIKEAEHVRTFVSLILVSKRTAGGG